MHWVIIVITGAFNDMPLIWWLVVLSLSAAISPTFAMYFDKPRTDPASAQPFGGKYESNSTHAAQSISPETSSKGNRPRQVQVSDRDAFWCNTENLDAGLLAVQERGPIHHRTAQASATRTE